MVLVSSEALLDRSSNNTPRKLSRVQEEPDLFFPQPQPRLFASTGFALLLTGLWGALPGPILGTGRGGAGAGTRCRAEA